MSRPKKKRVVGLDCHPDTFVAGVIVGFTSNSAQIEKVTGSLPIQSLQDWFLARKDEIDVVVLEASGNSFAIYEQLTDIGLDVLILESESVSRLQKELNETDRSSAVKIARVYLSGLTDEVWVPDAKTQERRHVYTAYKQAVTDRTRAINRIKALLNQKTIRLHRSQKLHQESTRTFIQASRDWSMTESLLLSEAFQDFDRAAEKAKTLKRIMANEIINDPNLFSLVRIYGLAHITIYGLMSVIGSVKRFPSAKKLVSYLGVAPGRKISGKTINKAKKGRHGRNDMRPLLVQAAQAILNHRSKSNPCHSWGHKIAFRRGRSRAIIAVARKIVTSVWYVLNGKAIPIQNHETRATMTEKLRRLVTHVGIAAVRSMGYRTYAEYIASRMQFFDDSTCKVT